MIEQPFFWGMCLVVWVVFVIIMDEIIEPMWQDRENKKTRIRLKRRWI